MTQDHTMRGIFDIGDQSVAVGTCVGGSESALHPGRHGCGEQGDSGTRGAKPRNHFDKQFDLVVVEGVHLVHHDVVIRQAQEPEGRVALTQRAGENLVTRHC
jgi:hypothetical protein